MVSYEVAIDPMGLFLVWDIVECCPACETGAMLAFDTRARVCGVADLLERRTGKRPPQSKQVAPAVEGGE